MIRPHLFISRQALSVLSDDQLAVALSHENAHYASRDNLKRVLMMLAPDVFPFYEQFRTLETQWSLFTEWAADDSAVNGDQSRSLSLASALVRVAHLSNTPAPLAFANSFLDFRASLQARVERLLQESPWKAMRRPPISRLAAIGAMIMVGMVLIVAVQPQTFESVHEMLEFLIQ